MGGVGAQPQWRWHLRGSVQQKRKTTSERSEGKIFKKIKKRGTALPAPGSGKEGGRRCWDCPAAMGSTPP